MHLIWNKSQVPEIINTPHIRIKNYAPYSHKPRAPPGLVLKGVKAEPDFLSGIWVYERKVKEQNPGGNIGK